MYNNLLEIQGSVCYLALANLGFASEHQQP